PDLDTMLDQCRLILQSQDKAVTRFIEKMIDPRHRRGCTPDQIQVLAQLQLRNEEDFRFADHLGEVINAVETNDWNFFINLRKVLQAQPSTMIQNPLESMLLKHWTDCKLSHPPFCLFTDEAFVEFYNKPKYTLDALRKCRERANLIQGT